MKLKNILNKTYQKLPKKELVAVALSLWLTGNAVENIYSQHKYYGHENKFIETYESNNPSELKKFIFWGDYSTYKKFKYDSNTI